MRNHRDWSGNYQEEQLRSIVSNGFAYESEIVNHSLGAPPRLLEKMLEIIPARWAKHLLQSLRRHCRQTKYLLTESALLIERPDRKSYYPLHKVRLAHVDGTGSNRIFLMTDQGGEPAIGPMERAELFTEAINRTLQGLPDVPTCNDCRLYQRNPDDLRGNAGSCAHYPLVMGNYDHCANFEQR